MVDIPSFSNAIALLTRMKAINENIKNAEFSNLLADLQLDPAETKARVAGLIEENTQLKERRA